MLFAPLSAEHNPLCISLSLLLSFSNQVFLHKQQSQSALLARPTSTAKSDSPRKRAFLWGFFRWLLLPFKEEDFVLESRQRAAPLCIIMCAAAFMEPPKRSPSRAMAEKIRLFQENADGNDKSPVVDAKAEDGGGDAMIEEFRNIHLHHHHHQQQQQQDPQRESGHHRSPRMDEEGLIVPKKLYHPIAESREVQDLNKEIKWNAKAGVNVLGGKSELEKAIERRKWHRQEQERKVQSEAAKTDFQKVLEERAKKIDELEKPRKPDEEGDSGHCSPEPESEFLKVHAQLKGAKNRSGT